MVSFFIYRLLNGGGHSRIDNPDFSGFNIFNNEQLNLLISNTNDYVYSILSLSLNSFYANKLPVLLAYLFFIILIACLFFYFYKNIFKTYATYLLLFVLIYSFLLILFDQFSSLKEINNRTLISSNITLVILLIHLSFNNKKISGFILLLPFYLLTSSFTLVSNFKSIKKYNKETINVVKEFKERESIIHLKKYLITNSINHEFVYTNQRRSLSFALDYRAVKSIPGEKYFYMGKMITPDSAYINSQNAEIAARLKSKQAVVVLFDCSEEQKMRYLKMGDSSLLIGRDLIIF
jgi:hypothetical protein